MKLKVRKVQFKNAVQIGRMSVTEHFLLNDGKYDGGPISMSFDPSKQVVQVEFAHQEMVQYIPMTNVAAILFLVQSR